VHHGGVDTETPPRIAAYEERRTAWTRFGQRHGLALFVHGHGALSGVHGTMDGVELALAEYPDYLELHAARATPKGLTLAICDHAFQAWCREPARALASAQAARAVDGQMRVWPLFAPPPAILRPDEAAAIPARTGDARFDDRFLFLTPAAALPEAVVQSLLELPSPVMVSVHHGSIRASVPDSALEDRVLTTFRRVVTAFRDAADRMTDLVDTTFRFEHVRDGIWVARTPSVWGNIEVVVGGAEDRPNQREVEALEPFFVEAYDRIVALRRKHALGRLYRPIRIAVNEAGVIGVQFQHRLFSSRRVMLTES
jgi:hypothetical protein